MKTKEKEKQNILEGWEIKTLGSLALIKKGEQLNRLAMDDAGEYPALNGGINPSGYTDKWNTEADTITISEGGNSCGYINFNKERFWCGGHCYALLNLKENVNNDFLYQALKSKQSHLMKLRVGSGLPNIQKRSIEGFVLLFPKSKKEQQKIAGVLGVVDEDILKTQEVIDATEKLKRGLMQKLFTNGIDSNTKFNQVKLEDVAKISTGTTPSTSKQTYYVGKNPFIKTGEIVNERISQTNVFISDQALQDCRLKKYQPGTILVAMYGQGKTRGQTAMLEIEASTTQNAAAIEPMDSIDSEYLWYFLKSQYELLRGGGVQGHISHLNLSYMKNYMIPVTSTKYQKKIAGILSTVDEKISVNKKLLAKLTQLKKGLMQDLLSGRVRVNK